MLQRELPVYEELHHSTYLFCRSMADGTIVPQWDERRAAELRGQFEVGLTVGGRYLLQKTLGNGSMGQVFLAKDLRLERPVALKVVLHRGATVHLEDVLAREARLGASLNHQGIAAVYDFGFQGNKSYTVFEFVEGDTLRSLLIRRGKIPLAETLAVVGDLADALDFAHSKGVVHRDLKPENVCRTERGEFKILDLGIARDIKRDVETGTYSGTPAYSSPEQSQCRPTDGKSDQYALGLISFEMLTGHKPFVAPDPLQLLQKHMQESPPNPRQLAPELPERAEGAILRALRKRAEERFASCREFAGELRGEMPNPSLRHVVSTPAENRLGFYVSHVAEESLLAKQIVGELEKERYSCWYYGRDALAGVPYSKQSRDAIVRSQAMILLVSRAAMRSVDFAREIEQVHEVGGPLLPLLIDCPREEFERLAPNWCRLLGVSPIIEYRRTEPLTAIVKRLVNSAQALKLATDPKVIAPASVALPSCAGQTWATDANQIDILDLQRVLFRNGAIDDFLEGKHRHFISASKGFGKTLLLTCKRQLLTQAAPHATVTMIPEGRPYLDFMSEMRSLSSRYESPLSELTNTKRLWNAALRISAISHHPSVVDANEAVELAAFPDRIQRWLRGSKIQPTVVFKELTALRVSELNRLIDDTENFLDHKLRLIHGGTYFFIDKVDQAIRHLSRDAWITIQAGLVEAAWETMNANSHVKIFASIRQEAFNNYESDIKANLFAATTSLQYSEDELQALLDHLARCYEGNHSFVDFLGLRVVRHGRRPAPEDSFHYVRRHTCGRPRDLVAIASAISSKRASLSEQRLREVVQQTGSTVLVSNVFDEVRVFLNCLGNRDARLRFLALLPGNILEKSEAIRLCEDFNGLDAGTLQHFGEDSSDIFHPFRDLYFTGLLGVVEHDPEQGIITQRFRRPYDSLSFAATHLPDSPVFLLHPALDTFIRSQRSRTPFLQYQHVPVGENMVWESHFPTLMQIEKHLQAVNDSHFVDTTHVVVKRIQSHFNAERTPFTRLEIERSEDWASLFRFEGRTGCDEVLFWLGELLELL